MKSALHISGNIFEFEGLPPEIFAMTEFKTRLKPGFWHAAQFAKSHELIIQPVMSVI
jgi:hypothetical protein